MKKINNKFKFPKVFNYYIKLLKLMLEGKPLPYRIIYCCGGKDSGKTYCICLFISYLFYYDISAIVIIFRKEAKDIKDTVQEVLDRLDAAGFTYKHNISKQIITNPSKKTKIAFYSLFNPKGKKIQRLGLTGNSNFIYEIAWFEEVFEMEEQSVRDARLAVRGAKYALTFFTTNPYSLAHWFVALYTKKLMPNRKILLDKGFMMKEFSEAKELVHYTNYRANPGITKERIQKLEEIRIKDPLLYDVVGIGLPGVEKGGVYAHLIKHVSRLIQPGNIFTAGLDWGFKKDPLTVILLKTDSNYIYVNAIEELQILNESRWSNEDLAYKVCKWLKSLSYLYPVLRDGLIVYCDKTNLTFIEMLNMAKNNLYINWLSFVAAPQVEVEFRIGNKQWLMSANKFNISLDCPILYQELLLATFDMESIKLKLIESCADHMMEI